MHPSTRAFPLTATLSALAAVVAFAQAPAGPLLKRPGVLKVEFVHENAPFPQCHASTIIESKGALIAAWLGGTHEGHADVGIWIARRDGKAWTAPRRGREQGTG